MQLVRFDNKTTYLMEGAQEQRESSFELLRIISMFSIAICHFATHGGFSYNVQTLSIPRFWWFFIEMGGNFGTNVFVLISGFFLVKSKNDIFNLKRILKFWGQVFFYSVSIYVILGLAGISEFSCYKLVQSLFPIIFGQWWFASTYFVLLLIYPFLNILLNNLDKKNYQNLLVLLITIWCIIPTFTSMKFQSNSLLWFITLYCVSGYIRFFDFNPEFSIKHYAVFWFSFSALRYLSSIILIILGTKVPFAASHPLAFYGTQSILTFLSALSLFMVFKNVKMSYHKWINIISSATFGVYLIHDNNIVRPFLWSTVFHNSAYQNSYLIIPYSIGVVCLVYTVCTIIDLLRQKTFERLFLCILNKNETSIKRLFESIVVFLKKGVFGTESR